MKMTLFKKRQKQVHQTVTMVLTNEAELREQIARAIEADNFYLAKELNDRQVHAVLAMRLRAAAIARGKPYG